MKIYDHTKIYIKCIVCALCIIKNTLEVETNRMSSFTKENTSQHYITKKEVLIHAVRQTLNILYTITIHILHDFIHMKCPE